MTKVSAPGKIHLIGEHAVVYGEPTIISSVGLRTFVKAEKSSRISIDNLKTGFSYEWSVQDVMDIAKEAKNLWKEEKERNDFSRVFKLIKKESFQKVAVGTVLNRLEIDGGVNLELNTEIPLGSGLGSSASLAVALTKAISEVYGKGLSLERVNEIAHEIECFAHGTPSGGDNTACCYGGLVWFQKGNPNIIKPLNDEIGYKLENFILVYTKKPKKTTGELVAHVRNLNPEFRDPRIKSIGEATREMLNALKERNFEKVKELINFAWKILSELGLSVPEADKIAEEVKRIGGAAKLCGACGGGIMLCYHEDKEKLSETIRDLGYKPVQVELGVEGVRIEKEM